MNRTLIVAKIRPGAEREVARIFAESDAGPLPVEAGVAERSLYSLHDLYIHLVEFAGDPAESVAAVQGHPDFRRISARLSEYVSAYDPDRWRSPRDAMARRFYHWAP
ncbi:TcmI family type II polyketide cyclase [Actinomadura craniellae]|uniref:TcmI family type II polyketide cyclase n=1 Tax=Actinomadura craniellae TaxID=2231787 RepID=A0A365H2B6_9ACTN|nr:TcmI family type II polyketide cyclase [Actinomadura craniellae]RAY13244.1 TcmI family type II polyketide cyclase [Actinomadura craniellae]